MERAASSAPAVVLAAGARTPFGRFGGSLRDFSLPALGAHVIQAALQRAGVAPAEVDEVDLGINLPGGDRSIARQAMLLAGLPDTINANSLDRACCSSMAAITMARRGLQVGDARIAVAGGTENMSAVPYFVHGLRWGQRLGDVHLRDLLIIADPMTGKPRAVQVADEGLAHGIGREEQDAWALRSQERWRAAFAAGRFDDEIIPVPLDPPVNGVARLEVDESPRETTLERLAQLPTVYGSATVTAGNAPGLSTGATALVLMDEQTAHERDAPRLGRIVSWAQVSGHPDKLASIPARAIRAALARADIPLEAVDLLEINEAFAAVPLVSTKVLADGDPGLTAELRERTNVNGGAIALGHPTGATAARLVLTLALELRRRGGGLGVAALCGGIGEGEAVVVRV